MSAELSLPWMAKPVGSCCCSQGNCWDKEAGGHMGQSSPLGSLQPAIPTLLSVVGPHFWRDRSLSAPLGSSEAILFPTTMLFVMSRPTSNRTLVVPRHCPSPICVSFLPHLIPWLTWTNRFLSAFALQVLLLTFLSISSTGNSQSSKHSGSNPIRI